ncbi:polycomb group RING finger protein 6-like [Lingula anatina]|nr:polycomb group RING finger protein 6-like [Lingula anatina]XP_013390772.1 polycomb group RING finger protein 6-like [Lingula anatina]|eukprot:XP_013390771.1 polycomb group RING finger protein 6-like [Lingula anatina]
MAGGTRASDKNAQLVHLNELNPFLTCGICKGYLIDATTITECLHSFCKSCIVRHGQFYLNCPTCNLQIHPTLPLLHCKLDSQKQDIVFKLLPNIYKNEQKRRKLFWKEYQNKTGEKPVQVPMLGKSPRKKKKVLIQPDPLASVVLEYVG